MSNSDRLETLMNQAEELMQSKKYEEAIALYSKILVLKPSSVKTIRHYLEALSKLDVIKQHHFDGFMNYVKSCLNQPKQKSKLLREFDDFLQVNHENPVLLDSYVSLLLDLGEFDKALEEFEQSLLIRKDNLYLYEKAVKSHIQIGIKLCRLFSKDKCLKTAIILFEKLISLEPDDYMLLSRYAKTLMDAESYEDAFLVCEKCLEIKPNNFEVLHFYGRGLIKCQKYIRGIDCLARALSLQPGREVVLRDYLDALQTTIKYFEPEQDIDQLESAASFFDQDSSGRLVNEIYDHEYSILLSRCAVFLAKNGRFNTAFMYFQQSLEINSSNPNTIYYYAFYLSRYATLLAKNNQYEEAFKYFEKSLKLKPNDNITLCCYAESLADDGYYEKAFEYFEKSLRIKENDEITLNTYATRLVRKREYAKAIIFLERALFINPNDAITLSNYANSLSKLGRYQEAFHYFEFSLSLKSDDIKTLIRYGNTLIQIQNYRQAVKVFESLVKLEPSNFYVLGQYGIALNKVGHYKESCLIFEKCLHLRSDNFYLFQYARALEETRQFSAAIEQLHNIIWSDLTSYQANVVRLVLGRLYYRIKDVKQGEKYFEQAMAHSDDKEKTLLYSARSILVANPFSEKAIEKLKQIEEDSPRYAEAMEMLTLNLSGEEYFEMVTTDTDAPSGLSNTEMLNRAMYHKIANEISILKGIAYRVLRRADQNQPLLQGIIDDIEDVFEEVDCRRAAQKSEIEAIPQDHYGSILAVIAKTAHDISDFVNNQLAIIESKTRRAMRKLEANSSAYPQFEKLLNQLELTQTALSDLKAINEGIQIKHHRFKVNSLFEKWDANPYIDNAQICLNIQNGDSEINSDAEKIKSALNELVENSLKHNAHKSDLVIRISSRDVINPEGIWGQTIPGEQQYLYIEYTDNGKGIPDDKKDWIFQPLKTTSEEGKGSGLGLFIIRKTLIKMNGYIKETGINGVRFELYIPYKQADGE